MGFFDDVIQKTKDTAGGMKLSSMISDEEKKINQLSLEIGQLYFQLHADSYEPQFEGRINAIKEAKVKIEQYEEEIKRLKGVTNCPQCGSELPYDTVFCSTCGHKMEQKPPVQILNSNQIACTGCGAVLPSTAMFCTTCGKKVETVEPTPVVPTAPVEPVAPVVEEPVVEFVPEEPAVQVESVVMPKVCANCGNTLSPDMVFCTNCGTRV